MGVFSKEWAFSFLAEWIVIIMVVKTSVGLSHGGEVFLAEIFLWVKNFIRYFVTLEFLFALAMVTTIWVISGYFARILDEMSSEQVYKQVEISGETIEQASARERLLSLIFGTGSILIIITALMRVDLGELSLKQGISLLNAIPSLQGGGASTVLYFMLGLALLSQTQLIELHNTWSQQKIPVSRPVARRWTFYSLVFLALLTAFISIFPTSYSLGILATMQYIFGIFFGILFFGTQVIIFVILVLLDLVFILFGGTRQVIRPPALPRQLPNLPTSIPGSSGQAGWLDVVKTLLFWSIFTGIMIFSINQFLRQHHEVLDAIRKMRTTRLLLKLWQWLLWLGLVAKRGIASTLTAGTTRIRKNGGASGYEPGIINFSIRLLEPRQKVRFFYLTLIRRAGESGLARKGSQTPDEFAASMKTALPGVDTEINSLTGAFVQARYSPAPVEKESADQARSLWNRIKAALKRKKSV